MACLKCGSEERTKAGMAYGRQRYKCKGCGYHYTRESARGKPDEMKKMALHLYLEGLGFRAIGRVLGVSNVSVLKWIRAFGEQAEALHKADNQAPKEVMIDEMWHFVCSKKRNSGSGLPAVIAASASSACIAASDDQKI